MKFSICLYKLNQGQPSANYMHIEKAMRSISPTNTNILILPYGSISGLASSQHRRYQSFQRSCQEAIDKLTATNTHSYILGTYPDFSAPTQPESFFMIHEKKCIFLDSPFVTIEDKTYIITKDSSFPRMSQKFPCINYITKPYAKSAPFRNTSPNTLNIMPLGIEDCGKYISVYPGLIYIGKNTNITTCLQDGLFNYQFKNDSWLPIHQLTTSVRLANILRFAIRCFFEKLNIKNLVIGLSGGIDSALNLLLYQSVLGSSSILAVNMPSEFNSATTKKIAKQLANNLNIPLLSIPISQSTEYTRDQLNNILNPHENFTSTNPLIYENIQARDRSSRILAGLASMLNAVFPCNANKTELTVGYGTLYGDVAGALAATGDLWKHEVYQLAREINCNWWSDKILPDSIFSVPPSAELSPQHNVEIGLGDPLLYDYHDHLFRSWVESDCPLDLTETLRLYHENKLEKRLGLKVAIPNLFDSPEKFVADCEHWWSLFRGLAVAKRVQSPPIIALSQFPFGKFHEGQGEYISDAFYQIVKSEILKK